MVELSFKNGKLCVSRGFDDHVYIKGWADRSCCGIGDQESGDTATYECDLAEQRLQLRCRNHELLEV